MEIGKRQKRVGEVFMPAQELAEIEGMSIEAR
jgi:hypothetical protein